MKLTDDKKKLLVVHLPDTRGVEISPYGKGNLKLGSNVYTYSKVAGRYEGSCPGSTDECEAICYAKRISGPVLDQYKRNMSPDVPPIPDECTLLRIHVSGDFDSVAYIRSWFCRLVNRPDVTCWAYTRSWRVPELLPTLEDLRCLPNVQLFASMDISTPELPPDGWRVAWIDGDPRAGEPTGIMAHPDVSLWRTMELKRTAAGTKTLICPEETKEVRDCDECGFCFRGQRNDVTFLRH